MRKAEQRLYDRMRRAAPSHIWLQRVENLVGNGMPDVYVAGACRGAWVELKSVRRPKRDATRLLGTSPLRTSQVNWLLKAATKGVEAYVAVGDERGALWVVPATVARWANDAPLKSFQEWSVAGEWEEFFARFS